MAVRREEHEYISDTFPLIDQITMEAMEPGDASSSRVKRTRTTREETLQVYEWSGAVLPAGQQARLHPIPDNLGIADDHRPELILASDSRKRS